MLRLFRDIVFFIMIFGFFNDNFMVELFGSFSLKAIFIVFVLINLIDIIKATLEPSPNAVIKSYYVFISILSIVTLSSIVFFDLLELIDGITVLVSIHVVFIYVSYYREFDKLLYFIWAAVFSSAVISLFNDPIAEFTYRITGGTADPVEFSVHLFSGMIIAIYLYNKNNNLIFLISSIMLFMYALLYAGSKTAILTIAILIFYTLVIRFRYIFKHMFSFKSFASFIIVIAIISQTNLANKLNEALEGIKGRTATQTETMRTANTRFASWEAGYGMIEDYLLTGVGVNQFSNLAGKYLKVNQSDEGLFNPHNIFVKIFSEAGLFSFLSFLAFLFFLLKTKYLDLIQSEYFWITLLPVVAILMGMALNITYKEHFWLSLALLSNIILIYGSSEKKEAL